MKATREPFIDWMKAIGMLVIVLGHTGGYALVPSHITPFNPKQLGVVFFFLVMGYTLAREQRPRTPSVYNRFFEVFLFGFAFAILLSLIGVMRYVANAPGTELPFSGRGLQLSNFLPFVFGLNVFFNNFPANPSTWYIGTYLHVLLLWAFLLRPLRVRWPLLVVSFGFEIVIRAVLMNRLGD